VRQASERFLSAGIGKDARHGAAGPDDGPWTNASRWSSTTRSLSLQPLMNSCAYPGRALPFCNIRYVIFVVRPGVLSLGGLYAPMAHCTSRVPERLYAGGQREGRSQAMIDDPSLSAGGYT
jgi:hypothetical protein